MTCWPPRSFPWAQGILRCITSSRTTCWRQRSYPVGSADPRLHPEPVDLPENLPEDLTGTQAPVDVLAAEEFPIPAGPTDHVVARGGRVRTAAGTKRIIALTGALMAAGVAARAIGRRRARG